MKMRLQKLVPGMQHGDQAHATLKPPARIGGKMPQHPRAHCKQFVKQESAVAVHQRIEPVRQREDAVEVLRGQQLGLPSLEPFLLSYRLTGGAVPGPAR